MMRLTVLLGMISAAAVLAGLTCLNYGDTKASPASHPDPLPPARQQWRVVVSRGTLAKADKLQTVFVATVLNCGDHEEVLYTPGLVGPILYPKTSNKGEPLETHVPPRASNKSLHDFLSVRPGEGFSRSFVFSEELRQLDSVAAVGAKLFLYKKGLEGRSDKVGGVIEAAPYDLEQVK
jgi:hypothetical protein